MINIVENIPPAACNLGLFQSAVIVNKWINPTGVFR